jgi:hypothetical protein
MPQTSATVEDRLVFKSNVLIPAQLQVLTFILGIILIIIYGALSLRRMRENSRANVDDTMSGKD